MSSSERFYTEKSCLNGNKVDETAESHPKQLKQNKKRSELTEAQKKKKKEKKFCGAAGNRGVVG